MTNNYLALMVNTDKCTYFILFKAIMFLNTVIIVIAYISKIGFLDLKKIHYFEIYAIDPF